MIQLRNVHFSYSKEHSVIDGINYTFLPGHQYIIQGKNGIGKTTLIKLILGLLKPTSGSVDLSGNPTFSYLPDNNGIYEFLTVSQNIQFRLGLYDVPFKSKGPQMESMLKYFGITKYKDTLVNNLSLGTKKKVAIICAVIVDADFLVLDEPSSGLDSSSLKRLLECLAALSDPQKSLLCITHEKEWSEHPDFEVLSFDGGRLTDGDI